MKSEISTVLNSTNLIFTKLGQYKDLIFTKLGQYEDLIFTKLGQYEDLDMTLTEKMNIEEADRVASFAGEKKRE